jgi:hypothetical protein
MKNKENNEKVNNENIQKMLIWLERLCRSRYIDPDQTKMLVAFFCTTPTEHFFSFLLFLSGGGGANSLNYCGVLKYKYVNNSNVNISSLANVGTYI